MKQIIAKKEYSKPYLAVEVFQPQEYCENCVTDDNRLLFNKGGRNVYYFLDLTNIGTYQKDERYSNTGTNTAAPDGVYKGVKAYYLERNYPSSSSGTPVWTMVSTDPPAGSPYDRVFTSNGNEYKFVQFTNSPVDVKIVGVVAYKNQS